MALKRTKNNFNDVKHDGAKIKVVGIGGAGGNALSRMCEDFIKGVDFIAINTDTQDLEYCDADTKIHIGKNLTKGLGTGMNPELGSQAAEETRSEIIEALKGADLVFLTAGFGGGTGTGATPIVAEAAKEIGALTIAVVTKPFSFEGTQRARVAQDGLLKLKDKVDTMIVIPNDRIFTVIAKDTTLVKAFEAVDDILRLAVRGISELVTMPGIINVDFADVKTVMERAGTALVGVGVGSGQDRAVAAVTQVLNSPLLEVSIDGAKGVLFGITGTRDLRMGEVNDIARMISEVVDSSAKIIFGAYHDRKMKAGQIKVTLIATGFNGLTSHKPAQISNLFTTSVEQRPELISQKESVAAEEKSGKQKLEPMPKSEEWDIPAFLRKKKK